MRVYYYNVIVLFIIFVACQRNGSSSGESLAGLQMYDFKELDINFTPQYIEHDVAGKMKPQISDWLNYYQLAIDSFVFAGQADFNLEKCYSGSIDSAIVGTKSDPMAFLYSFSPNKQRFIDLYFYAHYDDDRKAVVFDGEVDQLVWYYDQDSRMGYVVQSWGPSGICDAAYWLDNNTFILLSNFVDPGQDFYITIFDINNKLKNTYIRQEKTKIKDRSYFFYESRKKGVREPIYN